MLKKSDGQTYIDKYRVIVCIWYKRIVFRCNKSKDIGYLMSFYTALHITVSEIDRTILTGLNLIWELSVTDVLMDGLTLIIEKFRFKKG